MANNQDTQLVNLWSNDHILSQELAGRQKPRPTVTRADLQWWPPSWVVVYFRTDKQCIQRKICKDHKLECLIRFHANPFKKHDVSSVGEVTNAIYDANVEGLELEVLQLRNNLNLLDKIFCKTAQHIHFHTAEKLCNER